MQEPIGGGGAIGAENRQTMLKTPIWSLLVFIAERIRWGGLIFRDAMAGSFFIPVVGKFFMHYQRYSVLRG